MIFVFCLGAVVGVITLVWILCNDPESAIESLKEVQKREKL